MKRRLDTISLIYLDASRRKSRTGYHVQRSVMRGFGLVELMISLAIASFLVLGLVVMAGNTQRTNSTQTDLAVLNDKIRYASELFGNAIQTAGYYSIPWQQAGPAPSWLARGALFPAQGSLFVSGQIIGGTSGGGNSSDTLAVRFESDVGDQVTQDCLGGTAPLVGSGQTFHESQFSIVGGNLVCAVGLANGALGPTTVLIDGVAAMQVSYGIDDGGVNPYGPGWADTYKSATGISSMLNPGIYWTTGMRSVMITLYFAPTASLPALAGQTYANQPYARAYTQVFAVNYEKIKNSY
jgi:type II secretory pathway pseudopilin PulG